CPAKLRRSEIFIVNPTEPPSSPVGAVSNSSFRSASRFAGALDAEGEAAAILKGFDGGGHFEDAIADGVQAVGFVGAGEEFGFDDAGPVGDSQQFHGFAGHLMEKALFDDEAAGDDLLSKVIA